VTKREREGETKRRRETKRRDQERKRDNKNRERERESSKQRKLQSLSPLTADNARNDSCDSLRENRRKTIDRRMKECCSTLQTFLQHLRVLLLSGSGPTCREERSKGASSHEQLSACRVPQTPEELDLLEVTTGQSDGHRSVA